MSDDAFDDVVFDDGAERATVGQGGTWLTNLRKRLAFGDHDGYLGKAVAGAEGEEISILLNTDIDCLVEPIIENMAKHPIVGPDEILALGFDHHMRRLQRLDGFDSDDVDGTFGEVVVAVTQNVAGFGHIEMRNLVGDVDNSGIGDL